MRIPSGKTDQKVAFVAVDATDLKTRETGFSSFTVYRSRNGGTATVFTTPTVAELDNTNMPGVYVLTVDEDTTVAAGSDSEELVLHITHAGMAPVTRVIELYRRDTTSGRMLDVTAGGDAEVDAASVRAAVGLASANLDTQVADLPTNAELATALAAADDAVLSAVAAVSVLLDTEIAAILADTNELQTDWVDGGRLDLILDARASQTSVDDLPTNAELTTALAAADDAVLAAVAAVSTKVDTVDDLLDTEVAAIKTVVDAILVDTGTDIPATLDALPTNAELATALGTADDAVLAAISGLTSLDAAGIRAAVGLATANLDTQLGDLPTNAELATSQAAADDATLAAIAALNNLSAAAVNAEVDTALVDVGLTTTITGRIDAAISSRLATAGYTAPDNASITTIKASTDNLPSDPADQSLVIAATNAIVTLVNDVPTNAELATALGTADDAMLAAIAGLTSLDAAGIRAAVGLAAANLDTQLDALPTNAELTTALGTADDAVLAAVMGISVPTAIQNADALLDRADAIEVGLTPRGALRLHSALLAGKVSGAGTGTEAFRNAVADSKVRATVTVTNAGNRTAVVTDVT